MRVTFLAPSSNTPGGFYEVFADFLRVAAEQLDIDLQVVFGSKLREGMLERGREIAASSRRPDYVLLANYLDVAGELLPEFAAAGVRVLFVVEGMAAADRLAMERGEYSACLGEIIPDDAEAGRMLAEALVSEACRRGLAGLDGKVHVGALTGGQTQIGQSRFRGWQTFRQERPDVTQAGLQYGSWEEKEGRHAAAMLLRTAPVLNAFWCANDLMALGAASAATAAGRRPGEDVVIGGIDLLDRALAAIVAGTLHVSIGGHVVDGVRALLMLYDHQQRPGMKAAIHRTHLVAVKANEAGRYLSFMKDHGWRSVDFSRFSARRNPRGTPALSLQALLAGVA
jgi:ABC-type sugar transport system substrate-binding protein